MTRRRTVIPIIMRSEWEDRKARFPIHNLFDGVCLDTFLIVSRIEFVVFVMFLRSFSARLKRGSKAGGSQFKAACVLLVDSRGLQ